MFEYLDVFTRKLVEKISAAQFYAISLDDGANWPLLCHMLKNNYFWSDLCFFHFKTRPVETNKARDFFTAEYLYTQQNYEAAASYGHPMGVFQLLEKKLKDKEYEMAIFLSQGAATTFGILGNVFYVYVCQTAIMQLADNHRMQEYAQYGLEQLALMENSLSDENCFAYIKHSCWDETIHKEYGGYREFIEQGRLFFSAYLNSAHSEVIPKK